MWRPRPDDGAAWLIPAHAGKTRDRLIPTQGQEAHPRSRGENFWESSHWRSEGGSSPLTRGKPPCRQAGRHPHGLIPAHAGKTLHPRAACEDREAHPRSRGENRYHARITSATAGSSPLTRGKPHDLGCDMSDARLIPAHAGKTRPPWPGRYGQAAHPRSRGENLIGAVRTLVVTGSSPLTRGKHFPTCAFTAQIDQILETLELAVSSGSYSVWVACATDAPQDQVRSIGLVLPSSRGAS